MNQKTYLDLLGCIYIEEKFSTVIFQVNRYSRESNEKILTSGKNGRYFLHKNYNQKYTLMNKSKGYFLKNFYLLLIGLILVGFVLTPFLVTYIDILKKEYEEMILLILFLIFGYLTIHLYKKEVKKYEDYINSLGTVQVNMEEKLNNAFKYIGTINLQLNEIQSIFAKNDKYPETKEELRKIEYYLAEKILGIVQSEWIFLRIIDTKNIRTLSEVFVAKNGQKINKENFSNKQLISNTISDSYSVVSSPNQNFTINTYIVLPINIKQQEKIMIQSIANQVEMFYIIFASTYYKNKS
ncbi:hypothetical protein KBD33_01380 [Candidatus Gracilibacteria bacterium]|nr:hypothetical protein [Candidatus Gracilibacteria bacterium]